MKNDTVVFDLDGTLVDSAPDVCHALNRVLGSLGRRPQTVAEIKPDLGDGARALIERALQRTGAELAAEELDRAVAAFLVDYADNPVADSYIYPGAIECLSLLEGTGARIALCSNKPSVTAIPVLEKLSLTRYFDAIVCGDQVSRRKPDGFHVREAVRAAGGSLARAVMIGDSEIDIEAAIDAGIPSVAVTFGYARGPYPGLGADLLIDDFGDLMDALEALREDGRNGMRAPA